MKKQNKNLERTKNKRKIKDQNMDQDPSYKDKNQEPRTIILRPLRE